VSLDIQSTRDLIAKMEAGLRARSEGSNGAYLNYKTDREYLLTLPEIEQYIPGFIINSPDIEVAFNFMRNHASGLGSWAARREFISSNFSELRDYLNQIGSTASLLTHNEILAITVPEISKQLSRAKQIIISDPGSAVTKAETVLSAVCKHIIISSGGVLGKSETLTSLVSTVTRGILTLDKLFDVRSFSGVSNQAQLVAEIRNSYGDAHPAPDPDTNLAEFAVTTAGNLAIFLLKRYEQEANK
jgi:Abortive infection C-terminus